LICTNSLDLDRTSASILKGFALLPLALIVNISGAGVLLKFLTFNLGDFDLVIGSHKYVAWFAFFFPIIIKLKIKNFFKKLFFIYFILLVYFSFSRSLLLSTIFAILIYFLTTYKFNRFKTVLLISILTPLIFIGSAYLEFFSFSTEAGTYKEVSNLQRYSKVTNSLNAFIEKPYFGHGFGMSQIENKVSTASTNEEALELASFTRFSPEIMPIQILAEVGLVGFICFMIIFISFFRFTFSCLKIRNLNNDLKVTIILISAVNLMYFINSNSFSISFFYIFLLIPFLIKKSFLNSWNAAV
jgi:O-antigen ligase